MPRGQARGPPTWRVRGRAEHWPAGQPEALPEGVPLRRTQPPPSAIAVPQPPCAGSLGEGSPPSMTGRTRLGTFVFRKIPRDRRPHPRPFSLGQTRENSGQLRTGLPVPSNRFLAQLFRNPVGCPLTLIPVSLPYFIHTLLGLMPLNCLCTSQEVQTLNL